MADFGLSRKLLLSPDLQERVVDNPTWLAPEILESKPYTEKVRNGEGGEGVGV